MAVSDELGLTAQPVLTLERRHNQREDLRSLARLCRRFGVVGIVVGNPVHLSGDVSPQAVKTQAFAAELGTLTGLPIHLWDERLTTREAHQILYEAGHARQQHRRVVDQVAATLILKSFMEEKGIGNRYSAEGRGSSDRARRYANIYSELNHWPLRAGPGAIQKQPHAQSLAPLNGHQPHMPADMVAVLQQLHLRLIERGIFLQTRNPLFDRAAKPRANLKSLAGCTAGRHVLLLRKKSGHGEK